MSLRSKILVILSVVVLLYAAVDHVLQRALVFKSFVRLEEAQAERDLKRVFDAIDAEIEHLRRDCVASATSDEMYRFVNEGDREALERNVLPAAAKGQSLTLALVCDLRGKFVLRRIVDARGVDVPLRDVPDLAIGASSGLLCLPEVPLRERSSGIFLTEKGPILVSSELIRGSRPDASPRGTLVLGRALDAALVSRIVEQTGVSFGVWPADSAELPSDARSLVDELSATENPLFVARDDDHAWVYRARYDVARTQPLVIRADVERNITASGATAVRYALVSTVAAGILLMLVLLNLLQRTVLEPLDVLKRHALEIGRSEDFTRRIGSDRQDEVGVLAREFDGMIERVERSRAEVVKTARAAGMSEIATGVLHNVGNVLNSVNVSATLVAQRADSAAAADLQRVVEVLRPHAADPGRFFADDPRAKHLVPLLESIATELASEREKNARDLRTLREGIDHIKELVHAQQSWAGRSGVLEVVSIAEQIESAITFTAQALGVSDSVQFVSELEKLEPCRIDRHRLTEILVNLIQNSIQAIADAGGRGKVLLRLVAVGADRARIEVIDDGVGIPRENLARVFTHGFTTKPGGHGFGLHASANAATEMGGKLTAHSEGPSQGARFVLEFPVQAVRVAEVAA